ncbi:tetratricopeptide repeat protein [Chamaesiphon sp. VAR_48_metabat_403]|uniref:tetratricopeptide repeat protein n=1 Tax=Chamaesiphon sp. VAR_48_metabat_403 TaxID=2964700 RepID=UPI0037BFF79E
MSTNSKNSAAYHKRASAKEKLCRYAEAILDYTKSIELDDIDEFDREELDVTNSGCLLSYFHRGNTRLKSGDRQEAVEDYTEVISFRAITTDDLMIIAKARRYAEDLESAIRDFTTTID